MVQRKVQAQRICERRRHRSEGLSILTRLSEGRSEGGMKYALNEWGLRREFQERAEAGTTDSFPRGGRVSCLCPLESLSCLEKEKSKNSENPLISRLRKSNSNHYTNKKAQPRNILCTSLLVELPCTASMNKGFPERTTSPRVRKHSLYKG